MNKTIYYVPGLPGIGKTTTFRNLCPHLLDFKNVLYIGPSKKLGEQEFLNQRKLGILTTMINSDTTDEVIKKLTQIFLDEDNVISDNYEFMGQLINITDEAWERLSIRPSFNWEIWKDELPRLEKEYHFYIRPEDYWHITDFVCLDDNQSFEGLLKIKVKNKTKLKEFLDRPDDIANIVRSLLSDLLFNKRDIYTKPPIWERMVTSNRDDYNPLLFFGFLHPDWYQGTTIMGALFEKSPLIYWWKKHFPDVKILPRQDIIQQLEPFEIGDRLRIWYVMDTARHSKYQRDKKISDDKTLFDVMLKRVEEGLRLIRDNGFHQQPLGFFNNECKRKVEKSGLDIELVPIMAQGRNDYLDRTVAVIMFSLNKDYIFREMYRKTGMLEKIDVWNKINFAFQDLMRTNLRVRESNEIVNVIVDDKETATWIGKIANCPHISRLPGTLI